MWKRKKGWGGGDGVARIKIRGREERMEKRGKEERGERGEEGNLIIVTERRRSDGQNVKEGE